MRCGAAPNLPWGIAASQAATVIALAVRTGYESGRPGLIRGWQGEDWEHAPGRGVGHCPRVARRALAPLASLRLSDGVLRLVSAKRGVDTRIDKVQGRFDGLTISDQLRFNLSAVWRSRPITVAGALDDPESAAKGEPSPMVF